MPDVDINPSALVRQDSIANGATTPSSAASKPLPLNTSVSKAGKTTQSVPRVDIFPLYTVLKTSIGDSWTVYKEAVSKYILGALSQDELSRQIDSIISSTDANLHAHNQLICAIQSNVLRDPPETAVATWVSANDKPASVSKPASGDAAEQRLRTEVMLLPPRTRHRFKNVHDEPANLLTTNIQAVNIAKRPATSTTQASGLTASSSAVITPGSATATGAPQLPTPGSSTTAGLNKDAEIRRRYAQPLAQEAHDLPSLSAMAERIIPICYEEGLLAGANPANDCAELLSMALETMLKSEIGNFLSRVRANAPVSRPPLSTGNASGPTPSLVPPAMERTASTATSIPPATSHAMERTASHMSMDASSQPPPAAAESSAPPAGGISTTGLGTTQMSSITTSAFKRQLAHEEALFNQGLIKRTDMGLLPCEVASLASQGGGRGLPGDLRLAWQLGGSSGGSRGQMWWGSLTPWLGDRVALDAYSRDEWTQVHEASVQASKGASAMGSMQLPPSPPDSRDGKVKVGGHVADDVEMPDADGDVDAVGDADSDADFDMHSRRRLWAGASAEDREALGSLLDDCLAVGV